MGTLSQAKTLGGVGSILVLLTAIPTVGWVLGIVGFVMTLVAVKYISDSLQDRSIFNNVLISIILAIVGVAIAGIIVVATVLRFVGIGAKVPVGTSLVGLIAGVVIGLVVLWIVLIVSAYFLRKGYNTIGTKLNIGMFKTGALLYFIGAILTIIVIGLLLILVAQILFIVAFFSIPEAPAGAMGPGPSPPPPAPGTVGTSMGQPSGSRFCTKCGTSITRDASYCPSCGAPQSSSSM